MSTAFFSRGESVGGVTTTARVRSAARQATRLVERISEAREVESRSIMAVESRCRSLGDGSRERDFILTCPQVPSKRPEQGILTSWVTPTTSCRCCEATRGDPGIPPKSARPLVPSGPRQQVVWATQFKPFRVSPSPPTQVAGAGLEVFLAARVDGGRFVDLAELEIVQVGLAGAAAGNLQVKTDVFGARRR